MATATAITIITIGGVITIMAMAIAITIGGIIITIITAATITTTNFS